MNCPLCHYVLNESFGEAVHPNDKNYGITLYCSAPKNKCPAQEVVGHGQTAKAAYDVILEKYAKKR